MRYYCIECGKSISQGILTFSIDKYNIPLCIEHQKWIDKKADRTTSEVIKLYFALKAKSIPAELEKYDGYKHIDIIIPKAKINIEIDGLHHNYNDKQAFSDLKRTFYSFLKGYYTLRIPNCLVKDDKLLKETAKVIHQIFNDCLSKTWNSFYHKK